MHPREDSAELPTIDTGSHFGSSRTAGQEPLSTSSNPTGTSQYDTAAAGSASHGLREPYASRMPGGFDDDDAATTASVSSGIPVCTFWSVISPPTAPLTQECA